MNEADYILRRSSRRNMWQPHGGLALAQKVLKQWFGILHSLVSDNGKQFSNKKGRNLYEELGIAKHFSSPHHPQANGQVVAVNKIIKYTLKRKLEASKGAWVEELPHVLWAIRTTAKTYTGETPFSMAYNSEAMTPVELGIPSPRRLLFNENYKMSSSKPASTY
ncbi:Ribonuclease H [Abeliophyllum distichum]|uniref:Ribonuclease H n=1 Tax=Abeliophyllum distichum TaxID=126358 RepID=A0ABD1REC5_9LAMI